nr:XdhC family protein [Nocardia amikacinitolerans]
MSHPQSPMRSSTLRVVVSASCRSPSSSCFEHRGQQLHGRTLMMNIAGALADWWRQGSPFALATVVGVSGSAPLPPGTSLAVAADGTVVGSISGGCVEAAVYETCRDVLERHDTVVRTRFGYSDADAFAVGLTCGGELDVVVQRVDPATTPQLATALADIACERSFAVAQVVDGPAELRGRLIHVPSEESLSGTLGDPEIDRAVVAAARTQLEVGAAECVELGHNSPWRLAVFIHVRTQRPRMLIFGAIDFAAALSTVGSFLGYRVTVCDARATFATPERFPDAEVVVDWPHRYLSTVDTDERTAICVLTHDPKFDVPLLRLALGRRVGYVGAMGSRRSHQHRLDLLRDAGVPLGQLDRLHSPIGLDLGARTPAETAVSIVAEVIAHTNDRSGHRLSHTSGPIHNDPLREKQGDQGGSDSQDPDCEYRLQCPWRVTEFHELVPDEKNFHKGDTERNSSARSAAYAGDQVV